MTDESMKFAFAWAIIRPISMTHNLFELNLPRIVFQIIKKAVIAKSNSTADESPKEGKQF